MNLGIGRTVRFLAAGAVFFALLSSASGAAPQPRALPLLQAGPLIPEMVGYWPLNETVIGTVADLSGYGNNGTHVNNPTLSPSLPPMTNNACNVRSVGVGSAANQMVDVPDSPSLSVTGGITLAAWIRTNGPQATQQGIIEKFDGPSPYYNGYYIRLTTNLMINFNILGSGGGAQGFTTSPRAVPAGTWTHVAGTYSPASGLMNIYMDGNVDASSYVSTAAPGDGTSPLTIGSSGGAQPFNGELDEVRVYNRALTQAEIQILMAGQPPVGSLNLTPGPGYIDLDWTFSSGAMRYAIYQSLSATGPFVPIGTSTTLTYRDLTATSPGTTYYYRVTAVSVAESCPVSASGSPLPGTPPPPPVPRTNDHEEGFLDGGKCGCGTARSGMPAGVGLALLVTLGLLALAIRC